jgi:hypothetical protein
MKKLGAILLLITIAIAATVNPGEAGWKKRGWYLKRADTVCVMRKVSTMTASGKVAAQKVRVCR